MYIILHTFDQYLINLTDFHTRFNRTGNYWNYSDEERSSYISNGKKHIYFDRPFQIGLSPT